MSLKLVTRQHPIVAEKLNHNEIYYADFNKASYGLKEQYKKLAELFNLRHCPIFCIPLTHENKFIKDEVSGSLGNSNNTVRIVLKVPESEIHTMEYYNWSDYINYSKYEDYDDYFNYSQEEALNHIEAYLGEVDAPINSYDYPQIIINRIDPKWVIQIDYSKGEEANEL